LSGDGFEVTIQIMNNFQWYFLCAFEKLRKATISCMMPVRPHITSRLSLDGFSWNLKIFLENLSRKFMFNQNRTRIKGISHGDHYTFLNNISFIFS
jgi:hypothetical protein